MDEAVRKAFILERYKELGVGGGAKKGAVKPATTVAAAAAGKKSAVKAAKAAEPPADEDDDDDDDAPAVAAGETPESEEGEGVSGEELTALRTEVGELRDLIQALHDKFDEQTHFTLETHALARQIAPAATGMSEEELAAIGKETYATLVGIQVDEEGNDD
jgi:hypothetical protein